MKHSRHAEFAGRSLPRSGKGGYLPSRALRGICSFVFLLAIFVPAANAQVPARRPKITGIASASFLSTRIAEARGFYAKVLDPSLNCVLCEEHALEPFLISFASGQTVLIRPATGDVPSNLLTDISFYTDDIRAMRRYLKARGIEMESPEKAPSTGAVASVHVKDPEGHHIWFVEQPKRPIAPAPGLPLRVIHAGFIVKDRAAEDRFYKDLLGFRPYWHGGMKDDETTWVSLQVPDGSDWLEYMLYDDSKADKDFRGVMNHFAVGVVDIHGEAEKLAANGWTLTELPKLGRDGKWQLNVYDPDHTRVEFMEFTPKEKPCCSEFTAPHPSPPSATATAHKP